mmetsp:Transcript_30532/g.79180  ORF Transcript_30532/g.79180 Transcript_30532/m.79180 type:complete len:218 (-) Transcript_30532:1119-1772(-)
MIQKGRVIVENDTFVSSQVLPSTKGSTTPSFFSFRDESDLRWDGGHVVGVTGNRRGRMGRSTRSRQSPFSLWGLYFALIESLVYVDILSETFREASSFANESCAVLREPVRGANICLVLFHIREANDFCTGEAFSSSPDFALRRGDVRSFIEGGERKGCCSTRDAKERDFLSLSSSFVSSHAEETRSRERGTWGGFLSVVDSGTSSRGSAKAEPSRW